MKTKLFVFALKVYYLYTFPHTHLLTESALLGALSKRWDVMDAMNSIILRGRVSGLPRYSHESHQTRYYQMELTTTRLSGTEDILRVLLGEPLALAHADLFPGESVELVGSLRSFNNKSGQGSRLMLSALAKALSHSELPSENRVLLSGTLCKPPVYRRTPLGREICDLMVAVPRRYGRADYLPVIAWGTCARLGAEKEVGDAITVEGRFQSRKYVKLLGDLGEERVAYEVSAVHIDGEIAVL